MERFTERTTCGVPNLAYPKSCYYKDGTKDLIAASAYRQLAIDRLAGYEDTGLEPEQVMELKSFTQGGIHKVDDGWKHVQELIQAEQDGRLVVLPCKVVCGTTIWWADSNIHTNPVKCEVSSFGIYTGPDGELQLWMNCYVYGPTPMSRSFRVSSICKTVFLTREEAEAALAGKGGDG